jgi:hypothetical protein
VAALEDGRIAVRDSKAVLLLPRAQLAVWVSGVQAGDFDDLT